MKDFSHFNETGRAKMVDVSQKEETDRRALAHAIVKVNEETFELIKKGGLKKGDVLATAQIAGIMSAKRTSEIIPMCHPLLISGIDMNFEMDRRSLGIVITAKVKCAGVTGVEMEALTAVTVAALTVYDMCKSVQKDILIEDIKLLYKDGGKSGTYDRREE